MPHVRIGLVGCLAEVSALTPTRRAPTSSPGRLALAAQRKPMNDNPDMPAGEALNPRARATVPWGEERATAMLVLADGTVIEGKGAGAVGTAVGEVCFNTAMTGYQEILTDPSYMAQIVAFTFPHVGNVGAKRGIIAITGVDTRALTALIRERGMPNAVIAHAPDGTFDLAALKRELAAFPGMVGLDLAKDVTSGQSYGWDETEWRWNEGYGHETAPRFHVVAIDYGLKRNILRELATAGCKLTVLPATATAEEVLARKPDGVFLSNGPGDPAATGVYAVPEIRKLIDSGLPVFGICLGHQMLGLALGGTTRKMHQGHHGANHPVKDFTTGKVEITSMNHGFAVDRDSLPGSVEETYVSLFDGSNCGLKVKDRPVFSVQYHPEASPGPQDSHYLFKRFVALMEENKGKG
jgi:carbamoyl-phosphate synthase small subunit